MKSKKTNQQTPSLLNETGILASMQSALKAGNYSNVRKLANSLLRNPETSSMRPQALQELRKISIDPVVILIGLGVLGTISLLSFFFMIK